MGPLFKILINSANEALALTRLAIGQTYDNTVDGIAALAFRDSSGNAVAPQLNSEGAMPVTFDAGTPKSSPNFTHPEGSQTKNQEDLVGKVTLDLNKKYNCFKACGHSLRLFKWRLAYIDDAAGTPVVRKIKSGDG